MKRVYPSARERILDAAERLIVRGGAGNLSVDAVLTEASISKGGFFHHFATKEDLLMAIMQRLERVVGAHVAALVAAEPDRRAAHARAQIDLSLGPARAGAKRVRALVGALIEAARTTPRIGGRARREARRAIEHSVAEGVPVGRALAIHFALDGFWLAESLGTLRLSTKEREALRRVLLSLSAATGDRR